MRKLVILGITALVLMVMVMPVSSVAADSVKPPKGLHWDVNFVTDFSEFSGTLWVNTSPGSILNDGTITGDLNMLVTQYLGLGEFLLEDTTGTLHYKMIYSYIGPCDPPGLHDECYAGTFTIDQGTGAYEGWFITGSFDGYRDILLDLTHDHYRFLTGHVERPNEILIPLNGTGYVQWTFGSDFRVVDNDANVNDGDMAIVQFPWNMDMYVWWLSARGKPGSIAPNDITGDGHTTWLRSTGAPTWIQWPGIYSWTGGVNGHTASLNNNGVTNLGLRVYPNQ